jgi:vacuolar-type H+-ATPase subunit C/Vma6
VAIKRRLEMILKKKEIDKLIEEAESCNEFIVNLYKCVFGDTWDKIDKLTGYPKGGEDLIAHIVKSLYKKFGHYVGMDWVSVGFSMDKSIGKWEVELCGYALLEEV